MYRFYWASLVLDIVLDDCRTANEVKNAVLKLPIDLEKLYISCLERKRRTKPLCDPTSIMTVCAAPRPLQADALCQLRAIVSGDVMSPEAVVQRGVGLITFDKTEQLVLPAHDSVRTFIFSPAAHTAIQRCSLNKTIPTRTSTEEHLGKACLLHIRHKASRSLTASSSLPLPVVPKLTVDMPSWIRTPMKMIWRDALDRKTVNVNMSSRVQQIPLQHDAFFEYARDNWLACNRSLILDPPTEQMRLFSSIAIERNESWSIHPWPALTKSRAQHLVGMFAYSVAHGHLPLLKLALQHKDLLPRGVFTGLLSNHGHLPALHAACKLGHSNLIPDLLTVCDPLTKCLASRTVLHYAAESGRVECLAHLSLLEHPPLDFINHKDTNQETALHLALLNGHEEFALCLVADYEADVFVKDAHQMSSIDLALDQGFGHFFKTTFSETQLGDWLKRDRKLDHLLVVAAGEGNIRRVQTLCWLMDITGANVLPPLPEESLKLALSAAVKSGHVDIIRVLLEDDRLILIMSGHPTGVCLPFGYAVSRHYQCHSISSQAAKDIVGLLTTFLTSLRSMTHARKIPDVYESEIFPAALQAAAEVGHVDAVRKLIDLRTYTSTPGHMADLRNNLPYCVQYRAGIWTSIYERKTVDVGKTVDERTAGHDVFRTSATLAAVRRHEEVLTLLLPTHDSLYIKGLIAQAESIMLVYEGLDSPNMGSVIYHESGAYSVSVTSNDWQLQLWLDDTESLGKEGKSWTSGENGESWTSGQKVENWMDDISRVDSRFWEIAAQIDD
jgi:hypothetical protein